jgi:hypothetical protein
VRDGFQAVKKLNFNISPSFCFNKLAGVKWSIFQFFHSLFAFPYPDLPPVEAAPRQCVAGAACDIFQAAIGKAEPFRTAGRQSRFVHE